jgi:ATP-dependent helicase/nuclease subunit A
LTWLRDGERQIKRDMEHGRDEVRVMTVHGSKGLEAPVVFLPDTCSGAITARREPLTMLPDDRLAPGLGEVCAWVVKGASKTAPIEVARDREAALVQQEHNRLLYVAMTRARDRLYVAGFENLRGMAKGSWYDLIETGLEGLLEEAVDDKGRRVRRLSCRQTAPAQSDEREVAAAVVPAAPPDWAMRPAPREANLTVPLAPSRIEPVEMDADGEWPALSDLRDAVRPPLEPAAPPPAALAREQSLVRGTLMHALLEHLPDIAPPLRPTAAGRFLAARSQDLPAAVLDDIQARALAVIADERFADAFGPGSRAEVPIAAVVPPPDGKGPSLKINGQIDRLVRTEQGILIIDYKSNRRPPASPEAAPIAYLMQLAAYRMVLAQIHGPAGIAREAIEAAILWTDVAALMPVPGSLLDRIQTRLWEVSR